MFVPKQHVFKNDSFQLSYRLYGATHGLNPEFITTHSLQQSKEIGKQPIPVVFLHGNLNSSCLFPAFENTFEICTSRNCFIIAIDRSGVGQSSFKLLDRDADEATNSNYLFEARKYVELIDFILEEAYGDKNKQIGVVGFSSGGLYALSLASVLNSRVSSLSVLSSDVSS